MGRQPYCEVPLDPYLDIPASGEHAQVVCEPTGGFTLHDANSSWGTYKNELRVSAPVQITTGDVITFGRDDRGNVGPQVKFYLARDILRCRVCEGPVYKRHFKCTGCHQKVCLRCVVVQRRLCKACVLTVPPGAGQAPPGSGRVPLQPGTGGPPPFGSPPAGGSLFGPPPAVTPPGMAPIRQTRVMPGRPHEIPSSNEVPVPDSSAFLRQSTPPTGHGYPGAAPGSPPGTGGSGRFPPGGAPPAGASPFPGGPPGAAFQAPNPPSTSSFKRLPPAPAESAAPKRAPRPGDLLYSLDVADPSATEPELKIPNLDDSEVFPPLPPGTQPAGGQPPAAAPQPPAPPLQAPTPRPGGQLSVPTPRPPVTPQLSVPTPRPPVPPQPPRRPTPTRRPPSKPDTQRVDPPRRPEPPRPSEGARKATDADESKFNFDVSRPAAVPCDRCQAPLNTRDFFSCVQCAGRLCPSHRATAERCDRCAAPPPAAPSGQAAPLAPAPLPPFGERESGPSGIPPTVGAMEDTMADLEDAKWGQAAQAPLGAGGSGQGRRADSGDDLARRPPGQGTDHGLAGMRFECPYCEHPLPSHARRCESCSRDL